MRHVCVSAGPCSPQRLAEPGECCTLASALTPHLPCCLHFFPRHSPRSEPSSLGRGATPATAVDVAGPGGAAVRGPDAARVHRADVAAAAFQPDRGASAPQPLSPSLRLSLFSSTLAHLLSLLLFLCLDRLLLTGPVSPAQEVSVEALLKNSGLSPELLLQALLPLTSDSGPLTLQEGQDFPPRGRSEVVGLG